MELAAQAIFIVLAWIIGASAILSFLDLLVGTEQKPHPYLERILENGSKAIDKAKQKISLLWQKHTRRTKG